jgi:hypothetical protein
MTFPNSRTYLAHTWSLNPENNETISIEFDNKGALVTWFRAQSFIDAINSLDPTNVPEPLIARTTEGWITLNDGKLQKSLVSTAGYNELKFRYRHAIDTGSNGKNYSEINGLTSKIDGLAEWAEMWPTETEIEYDSKQNKLIRMSANAKNLPPKHLPGELDPQLETYFYHKPAEYDEVTSISGALVYRTHSETLKSWQSHESSHQMMADLMTLAYGKACRFTIESARRTDDEVTRRGQNLQQWHKTFTPEAHRDKVPLEANSKKATPLFHLDETDSNQLKYWLSPRSPWRRALNIAISTYFSDNLTSEMRYINVAIALESLGYSIGKCRNAPKSQLKTFNDQVRQIVKFVGDPLTSVVTKSSTPNKWITEAGNAYNGLKHANRPATDWRVADEKAEQGLTLIRAWAAIELGVDAELVNERLKSH